MKQLTVWDMIDEPLEPAPPPEPIKSAPAPEWAKNDRVLQAYFTEQPDVSDPEQIVSVTSHCPTRHGAHKQYPCTVYTWPVPYSWLNPDVFWCRFPGGTWMQKEPLLCNHCATEVVNFLIKLIR